MFHCIMKTNLLNLCSNRLSTIARCNSKTSAAISEVAKSKWDLCVGVLVERLPILSKELTPFERQFQEQLWQIEYEQSLKSDHELKHEHDLIQTQKLKSGQIDTSVEDLDSLSKQTAQDLEDAYTNEIAKFQFAPRKTADDVAANNMSHNRQLDETLYLLKEYTLNKKTHYLLPYGLHRNGESMRQAAERVLRETCGNCLTVRFYGNAPCGFYIYKYPGKGLSTSDAIGAKLFFYRASLMRGNFASPEKTTTEATKFLWLQQSALEAKVQSTSYHEALQNILI